MSFVSLDDIKSHLRITGNADDALLAIYADAACEHVAAFTRREWSEDVPASVKAAVLLLTADLYENREAQSPVTLQENKTVERLLWPYREFC